MLSKVYARQSITSQISGDDAIIVANPITVSSYITYMYPFPPACYVCIEYGLVELEL